MIGCMLSAAFQLYFMALAINVVNRCDPSNKIRHYLQLKKNNVTLHYPFTVCNSKRYFTRPLTNKMECSSFKSGCVVR